MSKRKERRAPDRRAGGREWKRAESEFGAPCANGSGRGENFLLLIGQRSGAERWVPMSRRTCGSKLNLLGNPARGIECVTVHGKVVNTIDRPLQQGRSQTVGITVGHGV